MSDLRKHSIVISGHATSVSLETPFWEELKRIARGRGQSLSELVSDIDERRKGNLSSALRVFVLEEMKAKAGR